MYKCRMCPYHSDDTRNMYKSRSDIMPETIVNIARSIPNDPRYSFDISSIGETMIHKELADFIALLKRERPLVNTVVSTNALLLTEDRFRALAACGLDALQLSLYAPDAKTHEYITGTKTFATVVENIKTACRIKKNLKATKPYLQLFMIESAETASLANSFMEEWTPLVDKAFLRPLYNVGREIPGMTPLERRPPPEHRYPCITPWYSTAIRSNGDVLPCYMFHWTKQGKEQVIGNINKNTLAEIWASPDFRRFREDHMHLAFAEDSPCKTCDLWSAYTNIWTETDEGHFRFDGIRPGDFFKIRNQYRGG